MTIPIINLLDNTSSYLYNAFTQGHNVLLNNKVNEVSKITSGVILGDPQVTANRGVDVYPLYPPKEPKDNYHIQDNSSALTTMLSEYIEPNGMDKEIVNYDNLKAYSSLQDAILFKTFDSSIYREYLKLTGYLHLYKFSTQAEDLIGYMTGTAENIAVDNYVDYTNTYIMKSIKQAVNIPNKEFGTISVCNVDSNLQLVTKSLANRNEIGLVHKGNFIMLCFNEYFQKREEFINKLTDRYTEQGDFVTFFLNGGQPDAIVTALMKMF